MNTYDTLISIKIDSNNITDLLLRNVLEKANDHLPRQTRLTNPREENGRYIYIDLRDYNCGEEFNKRNIAYITGLLAGILIASGIDVI